MTTVNANNKYAAIASVVEEFNKRVSNVTKRRDVNNSTKMSMMEWLDEVEDTFDLIAQRPKNKIKEEFEHYMVKYNGVFHAVPKFCVIIKALEEFMDEVHPEKLLGSTVTIDNVETRLTEREWRYEIYRTINKISSKDLITIAGLEEGVAKSYRNKEKYGFEEIHKFFKDVKTTILLRGEKTQEYKDFMFDVLEICFEQNIQLGLDM